MAEFELEDVASPSVMVERTGGREVAIEGTMK